MMTRKVKIHNSLQKKLDTAMHGILLIVKLLNKDELNILLDDISTIIRKFYLMVENACTIIINKYEIITTVDDPTALYIIIKSDNVQDAETLTYSIYSQVQLHVDLDLPEGYLQCSVGGMKFSQENNIRAERLVSMLMYVMSTSKDKHYYYNYDEYPVDIDKIKKTNLNLNLLCTSLFQKKVRFMYQPVVDRKSGDIEYYECLLRVKNHDNQFISVGPMIQDAETKGLIVIVDLTVIEMAVDELTCDQNIKLSVNISNVGVLNTRLLSQIENLLKKFNVAQRLIIEITETSLNHNFAITKKFIDTLHSYGCKIALDDFGSGFTSFKQLLNLPIDIIKIDGSYIRDILNNNHSKLFVESLINLAKDLRIKTVAEFVENGEIAKFLIDIKIGGMQGDFFLPASEHRLNKY